QCSRLLLVGKGELEFRPRFICSHFISKPLMSFRAFSVVRVRSCVDGRRERSRRSPLFFRSCFASHLAAASLRRRSRSSLSVIVRKNFRAPIFSGRAAYPFPIYSYWSLTHW